VFVLEDDMKGLRNLRSSASIMVLLSLLAMPIGILAQTRVVAPKNPYDVNKDVELGRQAAQEVERQLPPVNDREMLIKSATGSPNRSPPNTVTLSFVTRTVCWTSET
jgi:hypothetical protein